MATKSKVKPATAPEAIPAPPKSAPKSATKSAPKTAPIAAPDILSAAAPAKDIKVAVKIESVRKADESTESTAAAKAIAGTAQKPAPKAASKPVPSAADLKPEVNSKARPDSIEDSTPPEKSAQKSAPKAASKNLAAAVPAIASKTQKWQEIKSILEKIKEDTLREISKSVRNGTDAVATNEPGGDIYDQASSERDRELGLLLGDREREKLHSIDEALLRIDEDEYGICEECDEDIPLGRLKAMPFTRHCVKCKSDLEKLQAQTKRFEEDRAYREIPLGSEEDEV